MRGKGELIPGTIKFIIKNMKTYGNILGVRKDRILRWYEGLNVKEDGECLFFSSCMYPFAGYGEIFLRLSEALDEIGIDYTSILSLVFNVVEFLERRLYVPYQSMLDIIYDNIFSLKVMKGAEEKIVYRYCNSLKKAYLLLERLGLECSCLGEEEPCCGIVYHTYGFIREFKEHAYKTYSFLRDRGVREIITPNPICAYAFKHLYPRYLEGFDITVKTVVEVLNEKMENIRGEYNVKVVIHDPCYLARHIGFAAGPREVLRNIKGLKLVEPISSRELTRCCGGGGVEVVDPKLSKIMATYRVKELVATGAQKIVTSCPICLMLLRLGLWKMNLNVEVCEPHEIVYESLKLNPITKHT